ncbi:MULTISPECIES: VacJ family lipoprotein [Thalassotalea]|uniref:VacJ family lipoprotein n=1 Tax=Thalassotalea castellviae TaxID=3075612 RepID=A0ABU2ZZT4_9GAMM|nr:VacJ family lipoprotein [Thalassotalea sp. W431]MDT0602822.1 VacJ family lipoprotein [Thalassotalea sp. W431]
MSFAFIKNFSTNSKLLASVFLFVLAGCSSTPKVEQNANAPLDPLESINRPFWDFTWNYADKYVLKPTSQAYVEYVNEDVRTGLFNMAMNLNEPSSIINHLLQGKFSAAAKNTGRFVLNSTIGLFGIFDPASDFGWTREQEEFGEVLGVYGVGDGPYLVVPAMGPTSVREEVGDYVDRYYWPLAIIDFWPNLLRVGVIGLEKRAALADQEQLINDSVDSYEFVKNAYFQNINYKVYDGNPPIEVDESEADLEAFMDEFEEID